MNDRAKSTPNLLLNGQPLDTRTSGENKPTPRTPAGEQEVTAVLLTRQRVSRGSCSGTWAISTSSIRFSARSRATSAVRLSLSTRSRSKCQQLYQTTLWPLAAINQARGFVSNSISSFRNSMNQIFNTPFTSAVLPGPQQFESLLHSRESSQIPSLQTSFTTNYGAVPQVNTASPAGPRDDGHGRRSGPAEPQDHAYRRPGRGRHSSDRKPDGKPGCA